MPQCWAGSKTCRTSRGAGHCQVCRGSAVMITCQPSNLFTCLLTASKWLPKSFALHSHCGNCWWSVDHRLPVHWWAELGSIWASIVWITKAGERQCEKTLSNAACRHLRGIMLATVAEYWARRTFVTIQQSCIYDHIILSVLRQAQKIGIPSLDPSCIMEWWGGTFWKNVYGN